MLSWLERTRNVESSGLDHFCAPSKVQPASIQRESVEECKGAIKQPDFISRPSGCSGNCPKKRKAKSNLPVNVFLNIQRICQYNSAFNI